MTVVLGSCGGLLVAASGFIAARTTPHWSEDRFNEDVNYSHAEVLTCGDPLGLFGGCFSFLPSLFTELRASINLYGCLSYLMFLLGCAGLAVSIPLYPVWKGAGFRAPLITLVTLPLQPAVWAIIACTFGGYVMGILLQVRKTKR